MKILVAVKRVIDYNVQIRVKEDGSGVVTDNVKMSTNPPDDNAVEEAVKIKEAGKATEIVAITVGEEKAQETVRKALYKAFLTVSCAFSSPTVIATISVAFPASFILTASSTALSSGGLVDIFTLSVTTPLPSSLTLI